MKLVVDRCWLLFDIEVVDMFGIGEMLGGGWNKFVDVIMVCGGGLELFIYCMEKFDDFEKKVLLLNV